MTAMRGPAGTGARPDAESIRPVAGPDGPGDGADGGRRWVRSSGRDRRSRARLELLAEEGVVVLDDRRIPGSRSSVGCLAVGPAGVFVIDVHDRKGLVHTKRPGPLPTAGPCELHVGRRNCTWLLTEMAGRTAAVRECLCGRTGPEVPVHAMLCLTRAQWGFGSPIEVGGVWVGWPGVAAFRVTHPAILDRHTVDEVSTMIADQLPDG